MKKMTMMLAGVVVAMAAQLFAATPTVSAVTAQQRHPWNGLVDIVVTISGAESDVAAATCTFAATNSATQTARQARPRFS